MSSKKSENRQSLKIKDKFSLETSRVLNSSCNKIENIPVSTAMSGFLKNLSEKQIFLKKEIEYHRNILLAAERKKYNLSSKLFPLIKSRYNKINYAKKNHVLNNEIIKRKDKRLQKSRSEMKIDFDNHNLSKNIFKTSVYDIQNPISYNVNKFSTISSPKISSLNNSTTTKKNNFNDSGISLKNNKIISLGSPINKIHKEFSKINFNSSSHSKHKKRRKKYKISVIKGWEFKNGFNNIKNTDKSLIEDKIYQKNLISNQIEIIIDNTNSFKHKHSSVLEKHTINNDINNEFLIVLNKLLEETCSLYIEIGHSIINDFESFVNNESRTHKLNPPEMVDGVEVSNEKTEYSKNIKILNECFKFLTTAYEIYLILNANSNYIIPANKILDVRYFLSRARYNINQINIKSKKYLDIIKYENNIVNLFNSQKNVNLVKLNREVYQNFREKGNKEYGADKIRRLNFLLNESKNNNHHGGNKYFSKKLKFIDYDDKVFLNIYKYMNPELKNRFEAFSVNQKKNKNKFERKVYKFNF